MITNRRDFLKTLVVTVAGVSIPIGIPFDAQAFFADGAESTSDSTKWPSIVGHSYLEQTGDHVGVAALKKKLEEMSDPQQVFDHLQQLIQRDYENGSCFYFGSWVLSHTEGRLCAI